jgi:hypothetical protein
MARRRVGASARRGAADADADALARYQQNRNPGKAMRIPGSQDRFEQVVYEPGRCVQEQRSGTRWRPA